MSDTQAELTELWQHWDSALDHEDKPAQDRAKASMVTLLNKRSYLRNLVRDVDQALED